MDIQNPIFLQIAIDLALFIVIVILIRHVNANTKTPDTSKNEELIEELKIIVDQSQNNANSFLDALEVSRKNLKELAIELEVKEKRIKAILEKSKQEPEPNNVSPILRDADLSRSKYAEVVNMIKMGYSEEETASATGFPRGEIALIVDLSRIKNENI